MTARLRLAISILLVLIAGACAPPANDLRPLRVGYIQSLSGLPFFIALDDNLFAQAGYQVDVTPYRTSDLATAALTQGEVDLLGVVGTSQILAEAETKGGHFAIAGLYHSTVAFVRREGADISSLQDLRGRRVGVFPGSVFSVYTERLLEAVGVARQELDLEPVSPALQVSALKEGTLDALITLQPTGMFAVRSGVGSYIDERDLFSEILLDGAPFPGGVMAVRREELLENPNLLLDLDSVMTRANRTLLQPGFDPSTYVRNHTTIADQFIDHISIDPGVFSDQDVEAELRGFTRYLIDWTILGDAFQIESVL